MYAIQETAMPITLVLPDALVKKMQTVAVPLQDTHLTVIDRAIDALIEKMSGTGAPNTVAASAAVADGNVVYPADAPPSLKFTKPLAIKLEGEALPKNELYWNLLLFRVIRIAAKKMEKQALRQAILVNQVEGKNEANGYRYISEAKLSVQGSEAKNAWKATIHLIKAAALSVDVVFQWENKEGAAHPGQVAHMTYAPA
jgi:hypothetical protein